MPKILIWANANLNVGAGHMTRMLAIAQVIKSLDGSTKIIFCGSSIEDKFKDVILDVMDDLILFSNFDEFVETVDGEIVLIDDYLFNAKEQLKVKNRSRKLIVVDDLLERDFNCDYIFVPNVGSEEIAYDIEHRTGIKVFAGREIICVREEFSPNIGEEYEFDVCITFGAGDYTEKIIEILTDIQNCMPGLKILVLYGGGDVEKIKENCAKNDLSHVESRQFENKIWELFKRVKVVVSGSGVTSWELVKAQVPFYTLLLCENQKHIYNFLLNEGLALPWKGETCGVSSLRDVLNFEQIRNQIIDKQRKFFEESVKAKENIRKILGE